LDADYCAVSVAPQIAVTLYAISPLGCAGGGARAKEMEMRIKDGAPVYTAHDQEVGRVDRVVLDLRTNEVTHLVVRKGWLITEDKVVPIELVNDARDDQVRLRSDVENLDDLPPFEETHYIPSDSSGEAQEDAQNANVTAVNPLPTESYAYAPGLLWYPPIGATWSGYYSGYYGHPLTNYVAHTEQNIPEGTVALKEGADVYSADGEHVGKVEDVLTNADLNRATHLRITEGWLFQEKRVIPVDWIRAVSESQIDLAVPASALNRVPAEE
jgi:uncharacterized protein YrrD